MSLEYILSSNQWFSATITQFPNHQYLKDFVQLINPDQQASLLSSNFHGFIYGVIYRAKEEQQFSSKLVHDFIMRLVNCGKNNEVWVKLDNHLARFSLQEFCLITGLPCHEPSVNLNFNNNRLRNQYFNGSKRISMRMLFEAFHLCECQEDKFKLGLVMLVECVLKPTGRYIDYRTLGMVEQLNEFLQYPWGHTAYFVLLNSLRESQMERVKRLQQNQQHECKYSLRGYPLAFQYWIYEAFPEIGRKFGRRRYKTLQCPRMHRWKPNRFFTEKEVRQFLADEEIPVIAVLHPTDEELQTSWYTTLSLPRDNQHNILDRIVNGEINNVAQHIPPNIENVPDPMTFGVGPSSASIGSNYVTREEIEEMLNIHRQHVVSDVCNSLKTSIVEESRKQENRYQAILQNQKELFEQQEKWQQDHFQQQQQWQQQHYQDMQSSMQSYVDTSLTSVRSYIDEQNSNMLNKLSNWEVDKRKKSAYWGNGSGNLYKNYIMDTTQE